MVVVDDHESWRELAGCAHVLVVVTDDEQAAVLADVVGDLNGVLDHRFAVDFCQLLRCAKARCRSGSKYYRENALHLVITVHTVILALLTENSGL